MTFGQKDVVLAEWELTLKNEPMILRQIAYSISLIDSAPRLPGLFRLEIQSGENDWLVIMVVRPEEINYGQCNKAVDLAGVVFAADMTVKVRAVIDLPDGRERPYGYSATLDIPAVYRCRTGDLIDPCVPSVRGNTRMVWSEAF